MNTKNHSNILKYIFIGSIVGMVFSVGGLLWTLRCNLEAWLYVFLFFILMAIYSFSFFKIINAKKSITKKISFSVLSSSTSLLGTSFIVAFINYLISLNDKKISKIIFLFLVGCIIVYISINLGKDYAKEQIKKQNNKE